MRTKIINKLINSDGFTISVNIATTKGMRDSYLGINVHFWNKEIKTYALYMKELEERHTAANIRQVTENCLQGINLSKILKVVSDGARNMTAAFMYVFF